MKTYKDDDFEKKIKSSNIELISFDIFDTLVCRPCICPKDIFYILDKLTFKRFGISFMRLRDNAELEMKNKYADINEIWKYIAEKWKLSEKEWKKYMQMEIDCEKQLIFRRQAGYELYMEAVKAKKKIIAISDMYLPEDVLRTILNKCGYTAIEKIYVSCNCKARKDDGELFSYVLKNEKRKPEQMMHIGDNKKSDIFEAEKKQIHTWYLSSPLENFKHYCKVINKKYYDNIVHVQDGANRILLGFAINLCFDKQEKENIITKSYLSHLFVFPLIFVIEYFLVNNKEINTQYDKIYFAARDGYLPKRVYDKFNCEGKKETKYLYVSRSTYQYTLFRDCGDRIRNTSMHGEMSFGDYIDSVVFDDRSRENIKKNYSQEQLQLKVNYNKDICLELIKKDNNMISFFKQQTRNVMKYYGKIFGKEDKIIIFDCGYSGSIAEGIKSTLRSDIIIDKVYLWETKENQEKDAKYHTRTYPIFQNLHKIWLSAICETMLSSVEGSCLGIEQINGCLVPFLEEKGGVDESITIIKEIQKESIEIIKVFVDLLGGYIDIFELNERDELLKAVLKIFDKLHLNNSGILDQILVTDGYMIKSTRKLSKIICLQNNSFKGNMELKKQFIKNICKRLNTIVKKMNMS